MQNMGDLPDDIDALKALVLASRLQVLDRDALLEHKNALLERRDALIERKEDRIQRLEKLVADFKRALFGARSEKVATGQYELALEDIETAMAAVHAEDEALDPAASRARKTRKVNRGSLPKHLPRIEEVIEPESVVCGCGGALHCIGEDVSEQSMSRRRMNMIVTRRPKYACRTCTSGVVQAPAPAQLIEGGCRR